MSEQKWREITFDDLREMSTVEQRTCRVRIGDVTRGVFDVGKNERIVYTVLGGLVRDWWEDDLSHWGAVYEAPAPPPRPLPTHAGAVIRLGDAYFTTYVLQDGAWWEPGDAESIATEVVQVQADRYGWVELVPAVGPDAEDGRSAGIREVEAYLRAQRLVNFAARVRDRFPEAFSDDVNPKETDDE